MTPKQSLLKQMQEQREKAFASSVRSMQEKNWAFEKVLIKLVDWFELHGKDLNPIPEFNADTLQMFLRKQIKIDGNLVYIVGGSILGAPFFFCYLELMPASYTVDLGAGAGMRTRIDFMETVNKANN